MSKYIWIIAFLIVSVLSVTGLVLVKNKTTNLAPNGQDNPDPECKEFFYNKDAKVRIVFFANKETTGKYANYLLSHSPYKENKDKVTIYYIDSYTPKCTAYKDIAVYCQSKEIQEAAEKCAAEYIIAFDNKPSNIRSSSYLNVVSININHPLNVIIHEFAHAFGKLEDEYVPAKLTDKNKNCKAKCDSFGADKNGCFEGCARSDFYRSIDKGVMRTLNSDEYGEHNEYLLEKEFE